MNQPAATSEQRLHLAREDHERRVAAAQAKLWKANRKNSKKDRRARREHLLKAAMHFLPPGEELAETPVLDLVKWPYAGPTRIKYAVPPGLKRRILRQDRLCVWCRERRSTTIDHVCPLSRGGSNDIRNLVGACASCNGIKSEFLPREIGWKLRLPLRAFELWQDSA